MPHHWRLFLLYFQPGINVLIILVWGFCVLVNPDTSRNNANSLVCIDPYKEHTQKNAFVFFIGKSLADWSIVHIFWLLN